ncbi:isoleucine--tRNA ligase, cytoplasmic [Neocloeon triangulifer]|uniref:isoleucine--tRNA ligase, cytoplasmic n=1 Tax=Neocloeon triangulifer TaxID=2078957 RepID=UPI00286EF07C|nr:isoleucine--tRNA ligase, cytoplasmic [Neocloeon triangulifer]
MVQPVPEKIDFPKEEEIVLELWKKLDAFQTCLKQSKGKPRYTFYDGPPFATGLPHYGHILAGTIKDIVTRYAHQKGFHVQRRFGWDCHGLPVEFEIDKVLGIKGPDDVAKLGIKNYNNECRKIVMRYSSDWERIINRLGRWIDFKNDYKTLYPSFMESVWWVFKTLYSKGLVYRGVKVMPYSTACNTPLSNFESGQNYKEVQDPAVVVNFPLLDEPNVALVAWTTTPWTLPSNLALCVNPELKYIKVKEKATGKIYILMEARVEALFKSPELYEVLGSMLGKELKGKKYKPIFDYFAQLQSKGAFQVLTDGYVTEESGTGIVHQAPYFGEDDYRVCLAAGVITKEQDIICPVDASGKFTAPVTDFEGLHVKEADKGIIKMLRDNDRLVTAGTVNHSYPFCWRSETPLIYKAVPSWFIRVEQMSQSLLESNQNTYWVPDFVKEKRFGNWLRDARDWAVSRNRYWGTPIPLWVSEDLQEVVCIGSAEELSKLSGEKIEDLHRESIDHITIPSKRPGHPPLKRVTEVFDCWFESGSMPYAQSHYPFEKRKEFEDNFPADFIAEGIDQTRGWFYTLLVISTAIFNKPPFKNLIANGLVLASDGQKMSKSKKNYPDPLEVVNKYGADALRLYLINSPVVRAENLRFKEDGVRDILKDVFLPWYNAYRFFVQNVERLQMESGSTFQFDENILNQLGNTMDKWVLSFTQSLIEFVKQEMAAYRLYTVVPRLVQFIENLTNWYVRMNRKRLKGEGGDEDCKQALSTLFKVLYSMTCVMAPFTPFLTELMYQNLRHLVSNPLDCVHYVMLPEPQSQLIDKDIERAVANMQTVIELGRVIRDKHSQPMKYPLPEVVVISKDEQTLKDVRALQPYVLEELNVRSLTVTSDKETYGVVMRAEPDHKTLGSRLKGTFKAVSQAIKDLKDADIQNFLDTGSIELLGQKLTPEDIRVMYTFKGQSAGADKKYEAHSSGQIIVLLDLKADQSMVEEGMAREVINRMQKLRKKAGLVPTDQVTLFYGVTPAKSDLERIVQSYLSFIENTVKMPVKPKAQMPKANLIMDERQQLMGSELYLAVVGEVKRTLSNAAPSASQQPSSKFINLILSESLKGIKEEGTIFLENPKGSTPLSYSSFLNEIDRIFQLNGRKFKVFDGPNQVTAELLAKLHGKTLLVTSLRDSQTQNIKSSSSSLCSFVDVTCKGKTLSVQLENPKGVAVSHEEVCRVISLVFDVPNSKMPKTFNVEGHKVTLDA